MADPPWFQLIAADYILYGFQLCLLENNKQETSQYEPDAELLSQNLAQRLTFHTKNIKKNYTLTAKDPKHRFWRTTERGSTVLGVSVWGSTVRRSTMLWPPIWDLEYPLPAGVHKAGVYSVEVYSFGGLQSLTAQYAFQLTTVALQRFWTKNDEKTFDFPNKY